MTPELHMIAHNIRSRENVGSLFRIADGLGIRKIWLTGYTPAPPHTRIAKASLGAEKTVSFEYREDVNEVIKELRASSFTIAALEKTAGAVGLAEYETPTKLSLVLGTETTGVPASLLRECDEVLFIPQKGKKESLNVAIAAAIAGWHILR
jgi:tRNA G18 (ribose-2'-O)-methylase SpoU